jgi:hypothetical protein
LKNFVTDTAAKTGRGHSTITRDVTRANKVPVLAEIVRTSLDKGDEIDALAKLPAGEQRKLAQRAKAGERVTAKPRKVIAPKDTALVGFTEHVLELQRRIGNHKPKRFSGTAVAPHDLIKLAKFFTELAELKTSGPRPKEVAL